MSKIVAGLAAAGLFALLSFVTPAAAESKADGVRNAEQVNLSAHRRWRHRHWRHRHYWAGPYYRPYYRPHYRPHYYGYYPTYYRPYRPYRYRPYYYGPGPFFPIGFGVGAWW